MKKLFLETQLHDRPSVNLYFFVLLNRYSGVVISLRKTLDSNDAS